MTMETTLVALLRVQCPRVHPDFAPLNTPRPYVTYQHIGGRPLHYLDGEAADRRHSEIQINTWADNRTGALALSRQIEDALLTTTAFTAYAENELIGQAEPDFGLYGCIQDFSILALR